MSCKVNFHVIWSRLRYYVCRISYVIRITVKCFDAQFLTAWIINERTIMIVKEKFLDFNSVKGILNLVRCKILQWDKWFNRRHWYQPTFNMFLPLDSNYFRSFCCLNIRKVTFQTFIVYHDAVTNSFFCYRILVTLSHEYVRPYSTTLLAQYLR